MSDFTIVNLQDLETATGLTENDFLAIGQGDKALAKATIQQVGTFLGIASAVNIGDKNTAPTEPSFAFAEAGTYPEWGNVEIIGDLGILIFDGTNFSKTEINFVATGVVEEGNTQAVSGGEVYNHVNNITPQQTTFAKRGANIFSGEFENISVLTDGTYIFAEDVMSAVVEVTEGEEYFFRKQGGNRNRILWVDSKPSISGIGSTGLGYVNDISSSTPYTAPVGAKCVIYYVSDSKQDVVAQITKEYNSAMIGYDVKIDLAPESVPFKSLIGGEFAKAKLLTSQALLYTGAGSLFAPLLDIDYNNKTFNISQNTRVYYQGIRNVISNTETDISFSTSSFISVVFNVDTKEVLAKTFVTSPNTVIEDNEVLLFLLNPQYPQVFGIDIANITVNGERVVEGDSNILFSTNESVIDLDYVTRTITIPVGTRVITGSKLIHIANEGEDIPFTANLTYVIFNTRTRLVGSRDLLDFNLSNNEILLAVVNPLGSSKYGVYGVPPERCRINGEMYIAPHIKEKLDKIDTLADSAATYFFLDDIEGIYDKPTDIPSGASGTPLDLISSDHSVIYDIYDDLLSRYPNYVTKRLLGNEQTGLPIYEYKFTSADIDNQSNFPHKKLKILVLSAIHGYEQGSAYSLAMFFKDLCENYQVKEVLEFMRWNVDFVVVPVGNPYGFDHNQRTNSNLVDLNRNFPANWSLGSNSGDVDGYYGGPSPASEIETQLLMQVIDENKDAEWFIDYHNISSGYPLYYLYDSKASTIALNTFKTLSRKWASDYPQAPQDGTVMGYVKTGVNACAAKYAIMEHGMQSFVFETPWRMPWASSKYDKVTLETGTETLGNTIVTILKSLK